MTSALQKRRSPTELRPRRFNHWEHCPPPCAAPTLIQDSVIGSQHVAPATEQLQVFGPMMFGVAILVMNGKRDVTGNGVNPTPATLFAFTSGSFKKPPPHMIRNPAVTSAAGDFASQPQFNVSLVIQFQPTSWRAETRPKIGHRSTTSRAWGARTSWSRHRLFLVASKHPCLTRQCGYQDSNLGPQLYQSCALAN